MHTDNAASHKMIIMHAYVHARIRAPTHTHTHARTNAQTNGTYARMHAKHKQSCMHPHTDRLKHAPVGMLACMQPNSGMGIHAHTHTDTHTHTHTHRLISIYKDSVTDARTHPSLKAS